MIEKGVSLKPYNTFGFSVNAAIFCRVREISELRSMWKTTLLAHSSPLVLGGGSNILFTKDYAGIILKNELRGIEIVADKGNEVVVRIGAGEIWHDCVLWAVSQGLGGIENLSLIPGCAGAAPIQNIGAYGVELEQVFVRLQAFDLLEGKLVELLHEECRFGYRDSIFKHEGKGRFVISWIEIRLHRNAPVNTSYGDIQKTLESWGIAEPNFADVSKAVIHIRQSKLPDPAIIGNCGSFFKNPMIPEAQFHTLQAAFPEIRSFPAAAGWCKVPAAWLIEQCGWKGFRRGDAGVHQNQALVLVNYGNAHGSEIQALALEIQSSVQTKFGIALEMEVNIR